MQAFKLLTVVFLLHLCRHLMQLTDDPVDGVQLARCSLSGADAELIGLLDRSHVRAPAVKRETL